MTNKIISGATGGKTAAMETEIAKLEATGVSVCRADKLTLQNKIDANIRIGKFGNRRLPAIPALNMTLKRDAFDLFAAKLNAWGIELTTSPGGKTVAARFVGDVLIIRDEETEFIG